MLKNYAAGFCLFMCFAFMLTGCDNSGYLMQPPYEISGTVTTGAPVSGTVHVMTYKRADQYTTEIDPETGFYSVSITKHDPPYLLWVTLDGGKSYFSYTSGERNPTVNEVSDLTEKEIDKLLEDAGFTDEEIAILTEKKIADLTEEDLADLFAGTGLTDEEIAGLSENDFTELRKQVLIEILEGEIAQLTNEGIDKLLSDRVFTQTVNISPLTDLIIGLAYGAEPQAKFLDNPYTGFPPTTPIRQMKNRIDEQLSDVYDHLDLKQPYLIDYTHDFNIFHNNLTDDTGLLLSILLVKWTDTVDGRNVMLTIKDDLLNPEDIGSADYIFFQWDLIEDETMINEDAMTPEDVLNRLKLIDGFP